ncbi:hypothetical protein [Streptomyces aureoversilis]|uniref:Secreted protein n=1 Tax=Streptomyces aureoversilis TaxID=67277 RepID=A0ABV9ZSQ9_9ACTN
MRRIAAVVLGAACFLGVSTTTATAAPDPVAVVTCATGDVMALVELPAPGAPPEVPLAHCLAP